MELLKTYFRSSLRPALLILCLAALTVLLGWLGGMRAEAMAYCMVLWGVVCALGFFAGFFRFWRKHSQLRAMEKQVLVSLDNLPPPENGTEEDYQRLLVIQHRARMDVINEKELQYGEMLDYFTLWAHQIKTPIAAMGLVLQQRAEPGDRELEQELFRIEQYVEMVLSYLRLDSEYTDFVFKSREIDLIIKSSVRKFAGQFIRKRLSLRYEETGLRAVTDEKWFAFVLEQLLANALKYTPSGSIGIRAEGRSLIIEDTGIGIAPEDLPRVFEKGYTGYNGRRENKSTGIGLYLCKRVLTSLGHRISIESSPGKGTRVIIDLGDEPPRPE